MAVTAGLLLAPTPVGRAEEYGPDLETYRALIERYRTGDPEGPVREAGSWGPNWIRAAVRRLLEWCKDAPGGGTTAQVWAAQGAFLLHTHAALANRESLDHEDHVAAAHDLLRWFRGRWERNPGVWPPEAQGLRPRHFYLALAAAELLSTRPESARELAEESLWNERRDGEMRLLAGCALEVEALVRRQRDGGWHDRTLREAEKSFREALEEDPSLQEARLRLGWVLVRRGRAAAAQPILEAVTTAPGRPGRRALAWLFLGAAHEQSRDLPAAAEAYRRAVEIAPHLQAAQLGLAHALERTAGDEAARAVLRPFFLERSRSWVREDPWNEYPYGPPELQTRPLVALIERLCVR